jgi:thermostable 8-oxoguanine DNA glycosylase
MVPAMKASEHQGDLNEFLRFYKFQPSLTKRLDSLAGIAFNQELINEIVLWKVNRYARLSEDLCGAIDQLEMLSAGQHRKAESILEQLLGVKGIDLPMASTFLRFRNPRLFQIIDRHAYRALTGSALTIYSATQISKKIGIYFDYLDQLIKFCNEHSLCFETSDRLLYIFDKRMNGKL